jgi:O-antigen/teichoic acid export membrane protein
MHSRIDAFLLARVHVNGAYESGIYASGYRLLDAANMVGFLVAGFLVPFIARHRSNKKLIDEAIVNTRHGLLFFGIGVVCFSALFAPWIQQLLYHTNNNYQSKIIQLCLAVLPAYLLLHIYGSLLTATTRLRSLIFIVLAAVLINLTLNLILIPSMGAMGCCIAAVVSQYFCSIACFMVATRSLQLPFFTKTSILYLGTAIGLSLFFYLGKMLLLNVWLILGIAICGVLLLLARQINYSRKYFVTMP